MTTIYKTTSEDGKVYIGISNNIDKRAIDHLTGNGSSWTKKHIPYKVEEIKTVDDYEFAKKEEQRLTLEHMQKHGIDNVRGGGYTQSTKYSDQTKEKIQNRFGQYCSRCGRTSHNIDNCFASTHINGHSLQSRHRSNYDYNYDSDNDSDCDCDCDCDCD